MNTYIFNESKQLGRIAESQFYRVRPTPPITITHLTGIASIYMINKRKPEEKLKRQALDCNNNSLVSVCR